MSIDRNLRKRRGNVDKRIPSIGIVFTLVIGGFIGFISFEPEAVSANILYVGGLGPGNFTYIQDAINAAKDGDIVYVYSDRYYENIYINKTINLIGEDKNSTIIDAGGVAQGVDIVADWVNVSGFTVINGQTDGIQLHGVRNCMIFNNIVSSNSKFGIFLSNSSWNNIIGNTVLNNYMGIALLSSIWNNITGNNVSNNDYGISLSSHMNNGSNWNNIIGNTALDNGDGIYIHQSVNNNIMNNNASSNTKCGIGLYYSNGNILTGNAMFLDGIFIQGYFA